MTITMPSIDRIEFVRHRVASHRRHYVDKDDLRVVLSRLCEDTWVHLRKVHFNDSAKGRRRAGYTTVAGRRVISLCAFPRQMSLNAYCTRWRASPQTYGALRSSQWPVLAIRRYMLYHTLHHELGLAYSKSEGKIGLAIEHLREALRLKQDYKRASRLLAELLEEE